MNNLEEDKGAAMPHKIICIGEVLWDSLPTGLFPGGAPFNVAIHLHQLKNDVKFVTRVGNDILGVEIVRRMRTHGLPVDYVQMDDDLPTGFVLVESTDPDNPQYDIKEPAAWDEIELQPGLLEDAEETEAVVFGSLAQRNPTTRKTVHQLLDTGAPGAFDVNLRPPYDEKEVVEPSLEKSELVKLNDEELERLAQWFGIEGGYEESIRGLADRFDCRTICVTRGSDGATLFHEGSFHEHQGYDVTTVDAVGAGDAFLAGLLTKLLDEDSSPADALEYANVLGAYVVTCSGATPSVDSQGLERVRATSAP